MSASSSDVNTFVAEPISKNRIAVRRTRIARLQVPISDHASPVRSDHPNHDPNALPLSVNTFDEDFAKSRNPAEIWEFRRRLGGCAVDQNNHSK